MAITTIGSMATYLANSFSYLPAGVSGTMFQTVDFQRMYIQQYTGVAIDANSVPEMYQPIILNFALANLVGLKISNGDGGTVNLGEMSVSDTGATMSAQYYRSLGESQLKSIPRAVGFARSLSS